MASPNVHTSTDHVDYGSFRRHEVASSTYPCPQVHPHLETHIAEYDADRDQSCLSKSPALLTIMLFAGVRFRHTSISSFRYFSLMLETHNLKLSSGIQNLLSSWFCIHTTNTQDCFSEQCHVSILLSFTSISRVYFFLLWLSSCEFPSVMVVC